ncbi:uncharacterized protein [Onthophagus taurus]|uniref:uncharacterized protein n=1 Tax=Onthophagus taurus TaxID=166361 RepID=UPI0039BE575B
MEDTNSTTLNTIDLEDTEEDSFFCDICNGKYNLQELFACYQGHFFCQNCYQQEYYKGKESRCPHFTCNAWIDHAHDKKKPKPLDTISSLITTKMFPRPGFYVTGRVSSANFSKIDNTHSLTSLLSNTSRPLYCPLKTCNKAIAIKSVDYHFECEHKHVALITTHLEARNGMEFHAEDIKIDDIMCICLLRIKKPEITICDNINNLNLGPQTVSKNPVVLIMATKLLFECTDTGYNNYCDYVPAEKYFVWVASNLVTNFNYTLALSSQCNRLRVKYFGPLTSLNENFRSMCLQNKGLILTEDRIKGMTGGFQKPLVLDILIHGPL